MHTLSDFWKSDFRFPNKPYTVSIELSDSCIHFLSAMQNFLSGVQNNMAWDVYGPIWFSIAGNAITTNRDLNSTNQTLNAKFVLRHVLIAWKSNANMI